MKPVIFIDGAAGTVGMALQEKLQPLVEEGVLGEVIVLSGDERKVQQVRIEAMMASDLTVLCLPDDLAREAAAMFLAYKANLRLLDASAAHRCDAQWVYGLPEITPETEIRKASLVANPGCFATGCILLSRPIRDLLRGPTPRSGAWPSNAQEDPWVPFQGITGYSAGGSKAVAHPGQPQLTQLGLAHRHLPEITRFGGVMPVLTAMVGNYRQGMLVQATVPLPADAVLQAYKAAYAGCPDISVVGVVFNEQRSGRLSAQACNGSNEVMIAVIEQPNGGTTVAAVYDNLGKGSAGAAANNIRLMLS